MKIVNDFSTGDTPQAGCVCYSGYKSTRGWWHPFFECNCNCKKGHKANKKANHKKADKDL